MRADKVDRRAAAEQVLAEYSDPEHPRVSEQTRKILLDAVERGYIPWLDINGTSELMLQRCFRGEDGTKLFYLNIYLHDIEKCYPRRDLSISVSLSPETQFTLGGPKYGPKARTVSVSSFTADEDSLDEIEAFFMNFYVSMKCNPYETPEEF